MINNIIIILCSCFLLQSCITPKMNVQGKVTKSANNYSAIAVDFVFIFSENSNAEIKKISAFEWFTKKEQFKNDYAINEEIQILGFEFIPGRVIQISDFKPKHNPICLIIFANYATEGEHRVVLKKYSNIKVDFKDTSFTLLNED